MTASDSQGFHFDPSPYSMEDLWQINDALLTVYHVLDGLLCQPRSYSDREREHTASGKVLSSVSEAIDHIRYQCQEEMTRRPALTPFDRERKFGMLATNVGGGGACEPREAMVASVNVV